MITTTSKKVDYVVVRHRLDATLDRRHARWLRGSVAGQVDRPEFHQHVGDHLIYRHPLIRYDIDSDDAVIAGLAEGSMLLRAVPPFDEFTLGGTRHRVLDYRREMNRVDIGPTSRPIVYGFRTPYLALNQENHVTWERGRSEDRRRLLERVVVGNMLSLSKSIGLHVEDRISAEVDLEAVGPQEVKPGVCLLGFLGRVRINFALPDGWGIGKSSSRGFGTLNREED